MTPMATTPRDAVEVPLEDWPAVLAEAAAAGYGLLDLLTAVDRPDAGVIDVVAYLVRPGDGRGRFWRTRCARDGGILPSVTGSHPAADWPEREIAEMFGVALAGHPRPEPLLTGPGLGVAPLRKEVVLVSRVVRPWPGGADDDEGPGAEGGSRRAGRRRRQPPPGVPEGWLREPAAEEGSG